MVKQFLIHIKRTVSAAVILLLILGVGGLDSLNAFSAACDPGCRMHQGNMLELSCCTVIEAHSSQTVFLSSPENHHTSPPCCEKATCIDPTSAIPEGAVPASGSPEITGTTSHIAFAPSSAYSHSLQKTFPVTNYTKNTPPIYLLTCAFLI